jgi:N-acyl homoserine lactone hydrolase
VLSVEDIRPIRFGDVAFEGGRWPMYVHVIEHPDGLVLVDTGMLVSHPEIVDFDPHFTPLDSLVDPSSVALAINTHLHFDHCGGNRLFTGRPIHVQRVELADARSEEDYTIPEWVDFPGATYEELDGETQLVDGVRVIVTPGHTRGHQAVVVDTDDGPVVIGGDVAYHHAELDEPKTEGQRRVRELKPVAVWLAHRDEPWRPD